MSKTSTPPSSAVKKEGGGAGGDGSKVPRDPSKLCKCKKSKCVRQYCVCFRAGLLCEGCECSECLNDGKHEVERLARLLEHLEDKVSVADCMKAAAQGCADAEVEAKVAALKIVSALAQTSSNLLSEYVISLKDTVLDTLKESRKIRKDDPSKFPVIKGFIMELRDILHSFKESEPAHAVHEELDVGLDKQRADWAKSKVPTTRQLVSLVDEFRGLEVAGAEAEV